MGEPDDAASKTASLRERLRARGAKPHSRMSDLSRYMLAHYEAMWTLINIDRYAWDAIAALLTDEEGLADDNGNPLSANVTKMTWSRVNRLRRTAPRSAPPGTAAARPDHEEARSRFVDEQPALGSAPMRIDIRPASLRQDRPPIAPQTPENTAFSLLTDEEVQRRIDDLSSRQGGRKIPPPRLL